MFFTASGLVRLVGSGLFLAVALCWGAVSIHGGGGGGLRLRLGSGARGWGPGAVPGGWVGPAGSCTPLWPVVLDSSTCHSLGTSAWVAACGSLLCVGGSGASLGRGLLGYGLLLGYSVTT